MSANATYAVWLVPGWPGLSSSADAQSGAISPVPDEPEYSPEHRSVGTASTWALAGSTRQTTSNTSVEQALMQLLGFQSVDAGQIPAALFRYPHDMQRPAPRHTVCADPVHLRAERDHARLVPAAALDIELAEAHDLLDALNNLVGADGLNFELAEPARWYLTGMPAHALDTWPVHAVAHRNVANFMPGQGEAAEWRRLMTEVQMLMHAHPVNVNREQRGRLTINGIWFWGGAACPESASCPAVRLFADDYFSRGLAEHIGLQAWSLSPGCSVEGTLAEVAGSSVVVSKDSVSTDDVSTDLDDGSVAEGAVSSTVDSGAAVNAGIDAAREAGECIIVVDESAQHAWLSGDAEAMAQSEDRLGRHWLTPFRAALSGGRLGRLVVDGCDGVAVHLLPLRGWARFRQLFSRGR